MPDFMVSATHTDATRSGATLCWATVERDTSFAKRDHERGSAEPPLAALAALMGA